MEDYGLLKVIHPSITLQNGLMEALNSARSVIAWHDLLFIDEPYFKWIVYFMILVRHCDLSTSIKVCKSLELAPRYVRILCHGRIQSQERLSSMERQMPKTSGDLYRQLIEFRTELILYMMALTNQKSVKKMISNYYNQLRNIQPTISGNDIKALGLKPGPVFRQILDAVLEAKLNGKLETRQDELQFVRQWIQAKAPNNFLDSK
jgi:tRNA nucleotidyltransferase (CCA-adding enzyme)